MKSRIVMLLIVAVAVMMGSGAHAQIQKGNMMVGATGRLDIGLKAKSNNAFRLNSKTGVFVKDGLLLGLDLLFGTSHVGGISGNTIEYGIGTFGRYYIADKTIEVLKNGLFFLDADLGFQGQNLPKSGPTTNGLGFGFGPGYAYFITSNIALETSLKYQGIVGFGSTAYQNDLRWNLGLQIYFPSKAVKPKTKHEL
jgi:hypothetical protein